METSHNLNYQLGLLHFAHLLLMADGFVDDRETIAFHELLAEEQIPDLVFQDFKEMIAPKSEREIYWQGVNLLNECDEQEKLCALVHLYRMAEADANFHVKEIRLLLYSLKTTMVEFEDVELTARLVNAGKKLVLK